jgi:hypothetical protein
MGHWRRRCQLLGLLYFAAVSQIPVQAAGRPMRAGGTAYAGGASASCQMRLSASFSTSMNFCSGTMVGAANTTIRTWLADRLAAAMTDKPSDCV